MSVFTNTKGVLSGTPKVFIAIPTYSGKLDANLVHSLIESIQLFEKEGIGYEFQTLSYSCHVDDARNELVRCFRNSDCDQLIFIDADVSWASDALVRLARYDRDIVAGVYPKRMLHDKDFPVLVEPGKDLWADKDGLVEVLGAPTGFMKIKRHVIEKLAALKKDRSYFDKHDDREKNPNIIIFERTYEDGQRFSGDYSFCLAWRKLGGKIYVDPELMLSHKGEVQFSGTLGDHWREKHGVTKDLKERKFKALAEKLRQGNPTDQDFFDLFQVWGNPFSASPAMLATCYWLAKKSNGPVIEAGSGLSTLVMALANPNLTVHCLEHEILWAGALKNELMFLDIKNVVVHHAELKNYGHGFWYDLSNVPKQGFAIAVCDGPPRKIGSRQLFFSELDQFIKDAVAVMDDADDDMAIAPMQEWARSHGRDEPKIFGNNRRFAISTKAG